MDVTTGLPVSTAPLMRWSVFTGVSLAFFFLNMATFTSLGVVLYTMMADLHWTATQAGLSFTAMGVACGVSSPFAAVSIKWIGPRLTIVAGCALLVAGFLLAAYTQDVPEFYAGMAALGIGFSLAGNVPGVYLIAAWFEEGSSRIIGFYLMLGALGSAFGPPLVQRIVAGSGGWRGHWQVMALTSAALAVACWAMVRDRATRQARGLAAAPESVWTPRAAIFTWQFLLVSAGMAATMACVTTNNSVVIPHLVNLGATPVTAALVLSMIAITATVVKGGAGRLCEIMSPAHVLAAGLVLQGLGNVLLGRADSAFLRDASALTYGTGWALTYVAGTIVLLRYFGSDVGAKVLSVVWLLVTVAAAGPYAAGVIADSTGSYAPIFDVFAGMLFVVAVPSLMMREPAIRAASVPAE